MALSTYRDAYLKEHEDEKNKKIKEYETLYSTQKQTVRDNYAAIQKQQEAEYSDAYKENAIQKKVNEFYIAEDMANMGLTDSGLSRMQVTANNLSYSKRKGDIDKQRQNMVDNLVLEMNNKITELDLEQQSAIQGVNDTYSAAADEYALNREKADIEAETERQKAYYSYLEKQQKSAYSSKGNNDDGGYYEYTGYRTTEDGEKIAMYTKNGKKIEKRYGTNPYTGDINLGSEEVKKYGVFSNGYQPKGIIGHGKLLDTGEGTTVKGKGQNIWRAEDDDTLWYWDGTQNTYLPYEYTYDKIAEMAVKFLETYPTEKTSSKKSKAWMEERGIFGNDREDFIASVEYQRK